MFCPPTGAKYHFFEDPAPGLSASFCCNIVVSSFVKRLRRVSLSSQNLESWRWKWQHISMLPFPQLHQGLSVSWKLRLSLCSRRWLKTRRSGVRTFKPLGLWQLDVKFGVCLINAKMFFKKAPILSELLISVSKLFHSITDKKKNYFSEKEKYALRIR